MCGRLKEPASPPTATFPRLRFDSGEAKKAGAFRAGLSCLQAFRLTISGAVPVAAADERRVVGRGGFEPAIALEVVVVLELRAFADVVEDGAKDADRHAVEQLELGLCQLAVRFTGPQHDEHRAGGGT